MKDDILKLIQSNELNIIQKYVERYLVSLQGKIGHCDVQLCEQSSSDQWTLSSLQTLDLRLYEFVRLHHIDLLKSINYRINKLNDSIYEKQLYEQLSSYHLSVEQV